MFNFTTQTVYNEINVHDLAEDGRRVPRNANLILGDQEDKPFVRIGNTRFDASQIESIEIKNPSKESLAEVTFEFDKLVEKFTNDENLKEITARIALYIGLSMNSQDSFYANDYVYKGRPFYVEFPVKKDEGVNVIANRVKKIADKFLLFQFEDKVLDVTATATEAQAGQGGADDTPATGKITFKGVNGYQQIKKAELQWYNPEAKTIDCCSMDGDFEVLVTGVPVVWTIDENGDVDTGEPGAEQKVSEDGTPVDLASDDSEVAIKPGLEAFGDYNWIMHNLRLPTLANTNYWSFTKQMGELPIPGQSYTQFIVTMAAKRDGIAGGVVGQRAVSVTTHVFYALGKTTDAVGTPARDIKDALNSLVTGTSVTAATTADTALVDPFANLPQSE